MLGKNIKMLPINYNLVNNYFLFMLLIAILIDSNVVACSNFDHLCSGTLLSFVYLTAGCLVLSQFYFCYSFYMMILFYFYCTISFHFHLGSSSPILNLFDFLSFLNNFQRNPNRAIQIWSHVMQSLFHFDSV